MGTFAFGRRTRDRVIRSLSNLRTFQANEGTDLSHGLVGLSGPYRRLTGARYGALPREYAVGLDEAEYVVYCYGTPIAWVSNADGARFEGDTPRVNYVPDWQYSATTTYYQSLVMQAWGGKFVDPDPRKSRRDNRGTARGRYSDVRYGRVPARETPDLPGVARRMVQRTGQPSRTAPSGIFTRAEVQAAHDEGTSRFRTDHRGVRYDSLVERDTSYERDMAEASGPPAYLLDRRYSDPDWTPWNEGGTNLPPGAESRDADRIEADERAGRRWRP